MSTFGLAAIHGNNQWVSHQNIVARKFDCGHCAHRVSSSLGYLVRDIGNGTYYGQSAIYICTECRIPTFFDFYGKQFPGNVTKEKLKNIPLELERLLNEARISASLGAYTASVFCCRKMLMNIAVQEGDAPGKNFVTYVEYLSTAGFVPPNGKTWVDYIRTKGNEANHEIHLMEEEDATTLLTFVELLLKFIYEFPAMVPPKK